MAYLDDLVTTRDTLAAALKNNAGSPNYNVDGQSFTWGELWDRLEKLNRLIAAGEGPFEKTTRAIT